MNGPEQDAFTALTLHYLRVDASADTAAYATLMRNASTRLEVAKATADRLRMRLTVELLADPVDQQVVREERTVRWQQPATPWQHWKDNRVTAANSHGRARSAVTAPLMWWLRRRPPRMADYAQTVKLEVSLDRYWAFPEARSYPPELGTGRPVIIQRQRP